MLLDKEKEQLLFALARVVIMLSDLRVASLMACSLDKTFLGNTSFKLRIELRYIHRRAYGGVLAPLPNDCRGGADFVSTFVVPGSLAFTFCIGFKSIL